MVLIVFLIFYLIVIIFKHYNMLSSYAIPTKPHALKKGHKTKNQLHSLNIYLKEMIKKMHQINSLILKLKLGELCENGFQRTVHASVCVKV